MPHNDGYDINQYECGWNYGEDDACLTFEEYKKYLGNKNGYGLHISDLKIYDTPRELGEFEKYVKDGDSYCGKFCFKCSVAYEGKDFKQTQEYKCPLQKITHPPQSWMYV